MVSVRVLGVVLLGLTFTYSASAGESVGKVCCEEKVRCTPIRSMMSALVDAALVPVRCIRENKPLRSMLAAHCCSKDLCCEKCPKLVEVEAPKCVEVTVTKVVCRKVKVRRPLLFRKCLNLKSDCCNKAQVDNLDKTPCGCV